MPAGDTTQGRQVDWRPGFPGGFGQPGDYMKVPDGQDRRGAGYWYLMAPNGHLGAFSLKTHTITEHQDGTITASPSLVFPRGWHGYLERGVWREV